MNIHQTTCFGDFIEVITKAGLIGESLNLAGWTNVRGGDVISLEHGRFAKDAIRMRNNKTGANLIPDFVRKEYERGEFLFYFYFCLQSDGKSIEMIIYAGDREIHHQPV